jgi:hypothetical protein
LDRADVISSREMVKGENFSACYSKMKMSEKLAAGMGGKKRLSGPHTWHEV